MNLFPPKKRAYACVLGLLVVALVFAILSQTPATHAATTFTVDSLGDTSDGLIGNGICADLGGDCTLRAAIEEANALAGDDTIQFSVTGTINLTGPLPVLQTNMTIVGPGSSQLIVRRNAGGNYSVLTTSAVVNISGLMITNGRTPDGTNDGVAPGGGGILQTGGNLTLRDVVISGNTTGNGFNNPTGNSGGFGGFGGGIRGQGTLTMIDCVVTNNATGNGGTGGSSGGSGGRGAGIYFAPGTLTMRNVLISANRTGNSGGPSSGNSGYGGGLWTGGDFFPQQNTVVDMENVVITNNSTGNNITTGDAGGGGGYYIHQGIVTLRNTTVSNNRTGTANPNGNSFGTTGSGAGIFNNGVLTIINSVINGNSTAPGTGGGSIVTGGGISSHNSLTMINSTVSGNSVLGDSSIGGGVFAFNIGKLVNCTITGNTASNNNGSGFTGHSSGNLTVANTIIAGNGPGGTGPDVGGGFFTPVFTSQGHNLIGNADGVTAFNATGDQTGNGGAPLNPQLGPLANNGGLTSTHALLAGSPALDAGSNALATDGVNALTTDQRGAVRIADSADGDTTATVEIGAYESQQAVENITDKIINEDTPLTFWFGVSDTGPAVTSLTATSSNPGVVTNANLVLGGSAGVRSLQITPVANQSGFATITVTVNFAGGGSVVDTFQLTVTPVNDAPTFNLGSNLNLLEDDGPQTIANFASAINPGPSESQTVTFILTPDNNIFEAGPAISPTGTLTFTPKPNVSGTAKVTVVLKDNGGTANGGQDTSVEKSFVVNVAEVNDAPSFTKGADQTVLEDAGFQFVSNWATNVSAGPNESQPVTFLTSNTNQSLFSTQPSISSSGALSFVPAPDASGSADVTVRLRDNGGTFSGGSDLSAPQTFKIIVDAVNDAATITIPVLSSTNQHTPLVFSTATSNPISIADVDAGTNPIAVVMEVSQGTLTLGSTAGLTLIEGDGVDDTAFIFTGTVAAINAGLNGLTFKPATGFSGVVLVQIGVDDQGHSGGGGKKRTTAGLNILVRSGGQMLFNTGTYGVNESGGTATITVLRGGGNAGTTTINYATANGTATSGASCSAGVDYLPASGTFTWNNGDSSPRTFTVTICNDGSSEEDETINLTLSNPGGTGSLGTQPVATLTIGNDDGPLLLTEENTQQAIALDVVNHTRDPFSLLNPFNLGVDQRRRVSLFVWRLGLLPSDTTTSVSVVARDNEGRTYNLAVEALQPVDAVTDVTQVIVRLPDSVIGAPRDLFIKVTLRGPGTNEAFIKIAGP
jgi:CSLREA domain-containing protein